LHPHGEGERRALLFSRVGKSDPLYPFGRGLSGKKSRLADSPRSSGGQSAVEFSSAPTVLNRFWILKSFTTEDSPTLTFQPTFQNCTDSMLWPKFSLRTVRGPSGG
jgi:hypothetical protein